MISTLRASSPSPTTTQPVTEKQKTKFTYNRKANVRDCLGRTALHRAAEKGDSDEVTRLIQAGVHPDIRDHIKGFTALILAVRNDRLLVVNILIAARADVNLVDDDGWGPLHHAMTKSTVVVVKALLLAGADKNAKDSDGTTPVLYGAQFNALGTVATVIKAGAEVNISDKKGRAPIHWAYDQRYIAMYELLRKSGAFWDLETNSAIDEIRLLASAWGIPGNVRINGMEISRAGNPISRKPFWILSDILKSIAPDISEAMAADKELDITKRLKKIHDGELVMIQGGCEEHGCVLVFYKGYFAICDRGMWRPTKVYKIDPTKMTVEHCKAISSEAEKDEDVVEALYKKLVTDLGGTEDDPVCKAMNIQNPQKQQKDGFCVYAGVEAADYAILRLQALLKGEALSLARERYKSHTTRFRLAIGERHVSLIEAGKFKKMSIDFELLKEILRRLKDPKWHPERFKTEALAKSRAALAIRIEKVL